MFIYDIEYKGEKGIYIPLHMNLLYKIIRDKRITVRGIQDLMLTENILNEILTEQKKRLKSNIKKYTVIFDFEGINYNTDRAFKGLRAFHKEFNNRVAYINLGISIHTPPAYMNDRLHTYFFKELGDIKLIKNELNQTSVLIPENFISMKNSLLNTLFSSSQDDINVYILNEKLCILKNFTAKKIEERKKNKNYRQPGYLQSSNVNINNYIDIKHFFSHPVFYNLLVYELAKIIAENNIKYDSFICSSNNGAVLATSLGSILNKNVTYIQNLGPKLSINDSKIFDRIKKYEGFYYIFDFMCLGSELRHTMMLTKLKEAKVIKAVGVSIFIEPFRGEDRDKYIDFTQYLFKANELDEFTEDNYEVTI